MHCLSLTRAKFESMLGPLSDIMQRESELLDLLDDKDEEIAQLEREVDQLAQEKLGKKRYEKKAAVVPSSSLNTC